MTPTSPPLKIGIAGLGRLGQRHAEALAFRTRHCERAFATGTMAREHQTSTEVIGIEGKLTVAENAARDRVVRSDAHSGRTGGDPHRSGDHSLTAQRFARVDLKAHRSGAVDAWSCSEMLFL